MNTRENPRERTCFLASRADMVIFVDNLAALTSDQPVSMSTADSFHIHLYF